MIQDQLTRLDRLLSKEITSFHSHGILVEKIAVSKIIANLCDAIASLQFALNAGEGEEGWKGE